VATVTAVGTQNPQTAPIYGPADLKPLITPIFGNANITRYTVCFFFCIGHEHSLKLKGSTCSCF